MTRSGGRSQVDVKCERRRHFLTRVCAKRRGFPFGLAEWCEWAAQRWDRGNEGELQGGEPVICSSPPLVLLTKCKETASHGALRR